MYDYKRREKNKLISNETHRALPCTCSQKFPPFSFPSLLTWSVVWCNLTTVAIFLNVSLIVDCSDMFILLCLHKPPHLHFLPSSICILSVYFLIVTPKIWLLNRLLPNPPISFISSHACGWLLYPFSPVFVVSFLSLGLLVCSLFSAQQPKTNSPSPMYNKVIIIGKHGICSLIVLPGRWVGCQSFLIPN